jgi:hypothetical protein
MIKIRRILGMTIVQGSPLEMNRIHALNGTELKPGDKIVKLPYKHHVHRNPRYPEIIKYLEEKEGGK